VACANISFGDDDMELFVSWYRLPELEGLDDKRKEFLWK
jgi:hypothetical protein